MSQSRPPQLPMPGFDEIQGWISEWTNCNRSQMPELFPAFGSESLAFCLGHAFHAVDILEVRTQPTRVDPGSDASRSQKLADVPHHNPIYLVHWQERLFGLKEEVIQSQIVHHLEVGIHRELGLKRSEYELATRFRVMPVREWNETFGNLWQDWETRLIENLRQRHAAFVQHHRLETTTPQPSMTAPSRRI